MRSQFVTASRRNVGALPYAFTEQGVATLSNVLRSHRAVEVNIAIMRTFVQLRRLMDSNRDLRFRRCLMPSNNSSPKTKRAKLNSPSASFEAQRDERASFFHPIKKRHDLANRHQHTRSTR